MNSSETFKAPSIREWRSWLKSHHASRRVVWLLFPKSKLVPTVTYGEALCWGWIDSLVKRIDDDWYVRKFTPRANPAKWSAVNIVRMSRQASRARHPEPDQVSGVGIGEFEIRIHL